MKSSAETAQLNPLQKWLLQLAHAIKNEDVDQVTLCVKEFVPEFRAQHFKRTGKELSEGQAYYELILMIKQYFATRYILGLIQDPDVVAILLQNIEHYEVGNQLFVVAAVATNQQFDVFFEKHGDLFSEAQAKTLCLLHASELGKIELLMHLKSKGFFTEWHELHPNCLKTLAFYPAGRDIIRTNIAGDEVRHIRFKENFYHAVRLSFDFIDYYKKMPNRLATFQFIHQILKEIYPYGNHEYNVSFPFYVQYDFKDIIIWILQLRKTEDFILDEFFLQNAISHAAIMNPPMMEIFLEHVDIDLKFMHARTLEYLVMGKKHHLLTKLLPKMSDEERIRYQLVIYAMRKEFLEFRTLATEKPQRVFSAVKDSLFSLTYIDTDLTPDECFANIRCLFETCGAEQLSAHVMEMLNLVMRSNSQAIVLFILSFEPIQSYLVSVAAEEKVEQLRKIASMFTFCLQDENLFITFFNRFPVASKSRLLNSFCQYGEHKTKKLEIAIASSSSSALRQTIVGLYQREFNFFRKENRGTQPKIHAPLLHPQSTETLRRRVKTRVDAQFMDDFLSHMRISKNPQLQVPLTDIDAHPLVQKFLSITQNLDFYLQRCDRSDKELEVILRSGCLLSSDRVRTSIQSGGLVTRPNTDSFDHRFVFFGMGPDRQNIYTPPALKNGPAILINAKLFAQSQPLLARHLVLKSHDWGMGYEFESDVELSDHYQLHILERKKYDNDLTENRRFSSDKSLSIFSLVQKDTSKVLVSYQYTWSELISIGPNVNCVMMHFMHMHFRHWPAAVVEEALGNNNAQFVSELIGKIFAIEVSLPNSVRLSIDFVEEIRLSNKTIPLAQLRQNLTQKDLQQTRRFIEEHPQLLNYAFVIAKVLKVFASDKTAKPFLIQLCQHQNRDNEPRVLKTFRDFYVITPELAHINTLAQLILENYNDNTCAELVEEGVIRFCTERSTDQTYQVGATHTAQMPLINFALGDQTYVGKDTFQNIIPNEWFYNFENIFEVRNQLMQYEIETLLTCDQNLRYLQEHKSFHPITGKGAVESTVSTLPKRLCDYQIKVNVLTTPNDKEIIEIHLLSGDTKSLFFITAALHNFLDLANEKIVQKDQHIQVACSVDEFLQKMKTKKKSYQAIIVHTPDGDLLLADRFGLAAPGGHNSDPYCYTGEELLSETGLFCREVTQKPIAFIGENNNTAVYMINYADCELSEDAKPKVNPNLAYPFKADETEFKKGSEEICSLSALRNRCCRKEMPLELIAEYQLQHFKKAMLDIAEVEIAIDVTCHLIEENNVTYKVPDMKFGLITIRAEKRESLVQCYQFLEEAFSEIVNMSLTEDSITIDQINPLKLAGMIEGKLLQRISNSVFPGIK